MTFIMIILTAGFLIEMLQILPPVLIITALITIGVPPEVIRKGLGNGSGIKGRLLSLLIGSFSAGPVYAAFPATETGDYHIHPPGTKLRGMRVFRLYRIFHCRLKR
ncbi:MAG: hypothetical protein JEY99_01720 [Spirochaetales bacterium]|nr:hypothetical protein [Spirochaetales bacterium]